MMVQQSHGPERQANGLPATLALELTRNLEAPSVARAAMMGRCDGFELDPSLCHTLVLLVSEVVSNAVLHSRGPVDAPIMLAATVTDTVIRVTVTDAGGGFTPKSRAPDTKHGGYGLYLVDKAAERWGVDRVGGTRVWFELPRTT
jgi:anti-sigma regulatory factor (Ser/Thr protein kinase)